MRAAIILALLGGVAAARPAAAQQTEDEARLVFTVGLAYTGGTSLWSVQDQPILVPGTGYDLLDLSRSITGSFGLLFSGMYFPKPALGLVGEAFFMGIGLTDQCAIASPSPNERTQQVCSSIHGASKSSSAVLLSIGPVLRAGADQPISPYIRAQIGILISNLSPVEMSGAAVEQNGEVYVLIYDDPSSTRVTPGFVFGGGVTTTLGKGWQLRAEVRDNLVQIATVAGPTEFNGTTISTSPDIVNEWKNLWSIVLGADIVLEKKRGRRY